MFKIKIKIQIFKDFQVLNLFKEIYGFLQFLFAAQYKALFVIWGSQGLQGLGFSEPAHLWGTIDGTHAMSSTALGGETQ